MIELTTISDKQPTLKEAQKIVGGYVQMPHLPNGDQLLVDEEGLLKDLDINAEASLLADQIIRGPALRLQGVARWR